MTRGSSKESRAQRYEPDWSVTRGSRVTLNALLCWVRADRREEEFDELLLIARVFNFRWHDFCCHACDRCCPDAWLNAEVYGELIEVTGSASMSSSLQRWMVMKVRAIFASSIDGGGGVVLPEKVRGDARYEH